MAIDTAEKRRSASGVAFLPLIPGVTPNAAPGVDWRQQVAWSYSGVPVDGQATGADYGWLYVHMRRRATCPCRR
jgi:hypothetical protein